MDPILLKYRGNDSEYLIYDSEKFHSHLQPKAVRSICARNFGLGIQGLLVGPVRKDGGLVMQIFSPDGEEKQMGEDALAASKRYLVDAGYIKEDQDLAPRAFAIGKIFLSEEFVNTYMRTA